MEEAQFGPLYVGPVSFPLKVRQSLTHFSIELGQSRHHQLRTIIIIIIIIITKASMLAEFFFALAMLWWEGCVP